MAGTAKTRAKPGIKPKQKPKTAKPKAKPAPKKTVNKKPVAKPTAVRKPQKDESLQIPNNAVIDDLTVYDWGNEKLTDNQKLFIIWFSTPGQECYRRATKAARKAGYTRLTADAIAYKLRRELDKHIRLFEENIGKVNIVDTAQRWVQEKIIRGDFDIKDYYETVDQINEKTGEVKRGLRLKNIEELTPEQRLCIDGVDVKGQKETTVYTLPDREKIRDSLIALVRKQEMESDNADADEETMEIIMERLTVKKTIRKTKDEISHIAGLIRLPKGDSITEL
ncbi:MAG: terminase small subunit [Treponema sp.]|jgi:hypothetical protein|nr:terminase small subunit [Treponema sp.]